MINFSIAANATNFADEIGGDTMIKDEMEFETNKSFIVRRGQARSQMGHGVVTGGNAGMGNVNIGVGADLRGATIINNATIKDGAVISE